MGQSATIPCAAKDPMDADGEDPLEAIDPEHTGAPLSYDLTVYDRAWHSCETKEAWPPRGESKSIQLTARGSDDVYSTVAAATEIGGANREYINIFVTNSAKLEKESDLDSDMVIQKGSLFIDTFVPQRNQLAIQLVVDIDYTQCVGL